jgi:diguanylate cyclase (GGDEF)-like protein
MSGGFAITSRSGSVGRRVGVAFPPVRADIAVPRPLVAALAVSAVGAAGLVLWQAGSLAFGGSTGGSTGGPTGGTAAAFLTAALAAVQMVCVPLLLVRRAHASDEHRVWRQFLLGVLVLATVGTVMPFLGPMLGPAGDVGWGDLAVTSGSVVASALFYQGLIHWNRVRTLTSDPSDWLNGVSAVLALVALGNLLTPALPAELTSLPGWQVQLLLFGVSGGFIVLGTCGTVAEIGGLTRDARAWWVLVAAAVVFASQVTCLFLGVAALPLTQSAWLLAGAVVAGCAVVRPGAMTARPAENQSAAIGALVVLVSGVAILVVKDVAAPNATWLITVFAAVAVLGVSVRIIRLVEDLSHLARTKHEARTDELTGIANRRGLIAAMHESLATAERTTLMIVDLDRFKAINDRHGHAVGDQLLREMTAVFTAHVPRGGLLARLGGDEFAVLLQDTPTADALAVAQALSRTRTPLSGGRDKSLTIDASVGVAVAEAGGPDAVDGGELMRRADVAMYRAKRTDSGVSVYDGASDLLEQERMRLLDDLGVALAQPGAPQIAVFFQPQLSTADGRVTGAEALVRWHHAELGILGPDRFVDLAEGNGLMSALTSVVLRQAAAQAARWRAAGHAIRLSVNLSTSCLGEPKLMVLLDEILAGGLDPAQLVLEITETSLMTDPETALTASRRIAERGVGLSIDDYGTGYSSLSYLNDLPASELKIDKSFTGRAVADGRTAAIVAGTVELAHRLGLRLVAEGVEDDAALRLVTDLGCDESQGYLHSRPLPADAFLEWLARAASPVPRQQAPARRR